MQFQAEESEEKGKKVLHDFGKKVIWLHHFPLAQQQLLAECETNHFKLDKAQKVN